MTTRNQLWKFDFTLDGEQIEYNQVIKCLERYCKRWCFQLEKGEQTGWKHYQGRVSLNDKKRLQSLRKMNIFGDVDKPPHWSPTMTETTGFDYVMKETTRVNGPWRDSDKAKYIPRQFRGYMKKLRPFQKFIMDTAYDFEDRMINIIICPDGGIGKSMIASLCELYRRGIDLPPCNDAEKLIQSCCNICMKKNVRDPSPIFIDLPRAFNQEKMNGIFIAIEQIKKGKLFDMRYNYTEFWIDSPQIWVFTNNAHIDLGMLSSNRWRLWRVNRETFELEKLSLKSVRKAPGGVEALACNSKDKSFSTPWSY